MNNKKMFFIGIVLIFCYSCNKTSQDTVDKNIIITSEISVHKALLGTWILEENKNRFITFLDAVEPAGVIKAEKLPAVYLEGDKRYLNAEDFTYGTWAVEDGYRDYWLILNTDGHKITFDVKKINRETVILHNTENPREFFVFTKSQEVIQ